MPESSEGRVAVYIDFDNIVISRYDQTHGRGHFHRDRVRNYSPVANDDQDAVARVAQATVDIGAVLDFASSFGSIVSSRAYADWSVPVNASYRRQLMERAVDLVQLFPAVASMKNGADIRLAVDVVEDLFRLPDLTHVVIVAGDSDYIALAQRCKRLGRYVVGIGVAGATSKLLAAACDEFADYDALPGITVEEDETPSSRVEPSSDVKDAKKTKSTRNTVVEPTFSAAEAGQTRSKQDKQKAQLAATALLVRALRLGQAKDDVEWLPSSNLKNQMLRMDPSFQESALGYKTFTDFVKSRSTEVELQEDGQMRRIRLRPAKAAQKDTEKNT